MKRLISILVSLGILAAIYWKIDLRGLASAFRGCDPLWMALSLAMVVPITLVTAWRLVQLAPAGALGFGESNRLILAASVLNMVLPSKMGDIAKAYFIRQKGAMAGGLALSLVVFEKACDMLSLLLWCTLGLLLYPRKDLLFWTMTVAIVVLFALLLLLLASKSFARLFLGLAARWAPGKVGRKFANLEASWLQMHDHFWADRRQLALVASTSVFLWFLHLLQIWMFILALREYDVPLLTNLALSPLAILAGLLPLTFAGVGTRDAALLAFFRGYMTPETAAALGLLCTSRYLLPAIGGLPFFHRYMPAGPIDKAALRSENTAAVAPTPDRA